MDGFLAREKSIHLRIEPETLNRRSSPKTETEIGKEQNWNRVAQSRIVKKRATIRRNREESTKAERNRLQILRTKQKTERSRKGVASSRSPARGRYRVNRSPQLNRRRFKESSMQNRFFNRFFPISGTSVHRFNMKIKNPVFKLKISVY